MKSRTMAWATITAWAVLALAGKAGAQETVLTGTLTDSTDAVLPGVTVTAVHVESGNNFSAVTDASGVYRIGALRSGLYRVTAELAGFTTATRENVELLLGQRGTLNLKLALSTVRESVTVTGEAPLIDTVQSKLGGNVDPRQMQELPVNGRNWFDLTMLAPGSRVNTQDVQASPALTLGQGIAAQLNVDGQQVTNMLIPSGPGQPRFSRDSIAEFQTISNRFDATQGRSMGVQINAITKSGTNRFSGSSSGYFRSDKFNSADFIVGKVLPYADQQFSETFGGPIKKDRIHFFGSYEYERQPQSFTFNSIYPRFNIPPLTGTNTQWTASGRLDAHFNSNNRLFVRVNNFRADWPYDPARTGGATSHPSNGGYRVQKSRQVVVGQTHVISSSVVNELNGGYSYFEFIQEPLPGLERLPTIRLRGYTIGTQSNVQDILQDNYHVRDQLSFQLGALGRHEFKVGGEYMFVLAKFLDYSASARDPQINATGGPVPANIEALFPVWNDPSTWNIAALSPITLFATQGNGKWSFNDPKNVGAAWVQDDWAVTPRLTLNLGLRYDLSIGALGETFIVPPFLTTTRPSEMLNFQPRVGAAYTLSDQKTVLRGGFGRYVAEISDQPNWYTRLALQTATVTVFNDGRPDFAVNSFNGPVPSVDVLRAYTGRDAAPQGIVSDDLHIPKAWQGSIGLQRQIGDTMSVEADYAYTKTTLETITRNANLSYNPATGVNYPFSDVSKRPYPDYARVIRIYGDGWSSYHGLQTAFTKRLSHRWQASGTYTFSGFWNADGPPPGPCWTVGVFSPCPAGFKVAPDLGGEYTLAAGDQRHRAVFNGIWQLPYDFQLSGLYFYGSGQRLSTAFGADLRDRGFTSGRLLPAGTIAPRNTLVGTPLHRVDLRLVKSIRIYRQFKADGIYEVFNLFNHENDGSFVTVIGNSNYGRPTGNSNVAYQPRIMQLGFRITF